MSRSRSGAVAVFTVLTACPTAPASQDFDGTTTGMTTASDPAATSTVSDEEPGTSTSAGTGTSTTGDEFRPACGYTPTLGDALTADVGVVVAGDFDGDGALDVATKKKEPEAEGRLQIFYGDPNTFAFSGGPAIEGPDGYDTPMYVGDYNGDGLDDVLHLHEAVPGVVQLAQADGSFTQPLPSNVPSPLAVLSVRDVDGDDRDDVSIARPGYQPAELYLSNGDGTFTLGAPFAPIVCGVVDGTWSDFDSDGNLDFALIAGCSNEFWEPAASVYLWRDGEYQAFIPGPRTLGGYLRDVAAGDIDGDGLVDLLVTESSTRTMELHSGNGDGSFVATRSYEQILRLLHVGDLDGDGDTDLLGYKWEVMTNDGNATFERCEIGLFNGVVVNDLDSDGDSELLTTTSIDDALHPLVWVRDP